VALVAEKCALAGVDVKLAEPAETQLRQDRKRRAKTDKLDARLLRELLMQERLPESWIAPTHILDLRIRCGSARPSSASAPSGCSASMPFCFTMTCPCRPVASGAWRAATRASSSPSMVAPDASRIMRDDEDA
jgi:hypothetical protein